MNDESVDPYELAFRQPDPLEIPRIAPDVTPIGGVIRAEVEDFQVEEVPLYPSSGEGEHVYVTIRKRNRTTIQIRQFLARTLGVGPEDVGFAGFKDKRAIATQTFSVLGIQESDVERIHDAEWIEVLEVARHKNKLRPGHLKGNKFKIRVSQAREDGLADARAIVDRICTGGLPNYYHGQRFGRNTLGARVGCALLHRDVDKVVNLILGHEAGFHEPYRDLYEEGKYEEALAALPPGRSVEASLLHALRRYPGNNRAAARRIPRQLRKMYFSAYQSLLFNWVLRERREWSELPYVLHEGDLAQKRDTGGLFAVEDVDEANERAQRHEIVPTGPMFGRKMRFPRGRPGAMEWAVLEAEGIRPQSFLSHIKGLKIDGTRRHACVWVGDVLVEEEAPGVLRFEFFLPPGTYATTFLDQIMGPGRVDAMVDRAEAATDEVPIDAVATDDGGVDDAGDSDSEPVDRVS